MDKIFTIEEANRTLPLVSRIVDDLVRDHRIWEDKVREFELATVGSSPEHPDAIAELLQTEAQRLAREIEGYIAESSSKAWTPDWWTFAARWMGARFTTAGSLASRA